MLSLSEELKRERELRGIDLKQIAEETKISIRFLEALESGQIAEIPGEFYRRSYLRAYARYLGLDENRAVNTYAYGWSNNSEAPFQEEVGNNHPYLYGFPWVVSGGVILASIMLIWAAGKWSSDNSSTIATSEFLNPNSSDSAKNSAVSTPFPAQTFQSERREGDAFLKLDLFIEETCWLQIRVDGDVITEGLKLQGFAQTIVAHEEIRLWLGNAGGLSYRINDQPGKSLGNRGQVKKDIQISRENFLDFVNSGDIQSEN